ncbi:MAG: hypothetical protein Q7R76_03685 [Candidatus Woesearchaeota archaeon]|nr:hypothetical protein [Candidatus Woesearchaeota archaeon]
MAQTTAPETIDRIISRIGIQSTTYWKRMLETLPPHEIGVVKASGKLLANSHLNQLAAELASLASQTGFYLPVLLGGGVDYDALPAYVGSRKVNGLRVTSDELIAQMLPIVWANQVRVADALRGAGIDALAIPLDAVRVKRHALEYDRTLGADVDLGYVGDVVSIDTKPIITAIYEQKIPVISHLGLCPDDRKLYNINATTLAAELVKVLGAKKLIILGDKPVQDGEQVVRTFFSHRIFEQMVADGRISGGMVTNIEEAFGLLKSLGPDHSVQITTLKYQNGGQGSDTTSQLESTGLLEELLGEGSGTKIMIPSPVVAYPLLASAVDMEQLRTMINAAFMHQQRKALRADYFAMLADKDPTIYLDAGKRGGAVTYPLPAFTGCEYLCKLFTRPDYEGLGVAASIMEAVVLQRGAVAWRSSQPSRLYESVIRSYGGFEEKSGNYTVYGVGIPDDKKADVILRVVSIPATLQKVEGTP